MSITRTLSTIIFLLLCGCLTPVFSQLRITLNKIKHQFTVGENAQFRISSSAAGNGTFEIYCDPRDPNSIIRRGTFSFSGSKLDTTVQFTSTTPNVVFFRATQNAIQTDVAAAFDPLSIRPIETEPADFDAFWNNQKARLAAVPINPVLTQYSQLPNGSRVFFIQLNNIDNRKVNGYLVVPSGAGRFPAVLMFPPFGDAPILPDPFLMTDFAERCKSILFYMSVHNTPPNQTDPNAYRPNDITKPETYYNTYIILGAIRAVDYLASRTDFNGSLGVHGNSQGGGLAISLTALDNRITACMAASPSHGEQQGQRFGRASAFPRYIQQARDLSLDTNIVERTSKYHDAMYFARRVTKPLMVLSGYRDDVTPASTHFAIFNQYRGKGVFSHLREVRHDYTEEFWIGRYPFFTHHLTNFINPFNFKKTFDLDAGPDRTRRGDTVNLSVTMRLDNTPNTTIPVRWEMVEGPANVVIANPTARQTNVRFTRSGAYIFRVMADDDYLINDSTSPKYYTMVDYVTVIVSGVGTKEVETAQFSVFPTPSVSTAILRWQTDISVKSARLIDINGRFLKNIPLTMGAKELIVDLSDVPDGIYFSEMTTNNGTKTMVKVLKTK
jgi:cephalosporin-C deacetylase